MCSPAGKDWSSAVTGILAKGGLFVFLLLVVFLLHKSRERGNILKFYVYINVTRHWQEIRTVGLIIKLTDRMVARLSHT